MGTEIDLDAILSVLGSTTARDIALSQLVGKCDLSAQQIERAIKNYEKAGRFRDAAYVALKAGMKERAEGLRTLAELINS